MPGGGVKKGESIQAVLLRGLKEEIGIIVLEEPKLFAIYHHTYLGVNDYPVIYVVKDYNQSQTSSPEIEIVGWFDYSDLPSMTSPGTMRRLNEYFSITLFREVVKNS